MPLVETRFPERTFPRHASHAFRAQLAPEPVGHVEGEPIAVTVPCAVVNHLGQHLKGFVIFVCLHKLQPAQGVFVYPVPFAQAKVVAASFEQGVVESSGIIRTGPEHLCN